MYLGGKKYDNPETTKKSHHILLSNLLGRYKFAFIIIFFYPTYSCDFHAGVIINKRIMFLLLNLFVFVK